MAEIKFMFKKYLDDPEKVKERDEELEKVKAETELVKQSQIKEAKVKMEVMKKKLQTDKQKELKEVKDKIKLERPGGGNSMIGDENFDYMLGDKYTKSPSPKRARRNSSVGSRHKAEPAFDDDDVKSAKNKKLHSDLRKRSRFAAP